MDQKKNKDPNPFQLKIINAVEKIVSSMLEEADFIQKQTLGVGKRALYKQLKDDPESIYEMLKLAQIDINEAIEIYEKDKS